MIYMRKGEVSSYSDLELKIIRPEVIRDIKMKIVIYIEQTKLYQMTYYKKKSSLLFVDSVMYCMICDL